MLDDLDERRIPYEYEPEWLAYTLEKRYLLDLKLFGGPIIEIKGYFSSEDRAKMLAVKKAHPDLDIRLLFQRAANKLNAKSKTTYAQWAEKHGFPWAEGRVPNEWTR